MPPSSHALSTTSTSRAPVPSPKSHVNDVGLPELKSVNRIGSFTFAVTADGAKFAISSSVSSTTGSSSGSRRSAGSAWGSMTGSGNAMAAASTPTPSGTSGTSGSSSNGSSTSSPPSADPSPGATSESSPPARTASPVAPRMRSPPSSATSSPGDTPSSPSSPVAPNSTAPATTDSIFTTRVISPLAITAADAPSGWFAHTAAPRSSKSKGTLPVPNGNTDTCASSSRSTTCTWDRE